MDQSNTSQERRCGGSRLAWAWLLVVVMFFADDAFARGTGANQVMIEAKVVSVARTSLRELGLDWQASPFQTGERGLGNFPGLEALLDGDGARTLARPSTITNTGRGATLEIGGKPVELQDVRIRLDLVPTVAGDRSFIELMMVLRVNELPVLAEQPAITPRRAENTARVENGGSVLIGGLFDPPSDVPWFGNLPFVGQLFKNPAAQETRTELLLVVTPWIVDPNGPRPSGTPVPPQVHRHRPNPNVSAPNVPNQKQQIPAPNYPYGKSDRLNP